MYNRTEFRDELIKQLRKEGVQIDFSILQRAIESTEVELEPIMERWNKITNLSRYVAEDAEEALLKLEEHGDGDDWADDVVVMWEPLEFVLTVSELLNEI